MGFLSFLSRKPGDKNKSDGFLKSRAYDTAPSGIIPVAGAYPVAGNGPNALETLSRGRSRFSRTQLSLEPVPVPVPAAEGTTAEDTAAPSPTVSRFREESIERPSTAPNETRSNTVWASASSRLRKNPLRGPPPVSFRMIRPSTANSGTRPGSAQSAGGSTPSLARPITSYAHSRSNSIRSEGAKGFKDILDAQSEINPADFKTRVKAAGARDYGEDVAERNMGINGFELESPHVQAFYAQANPPHSANHDDHASHADLKPIVYATGVRTKTMNSSLQYPLPKRTTAAHYPRSASSHHPGAPLSFGSNPSGAGVVKRRSSMNTYLPGAFSATKAADGSSHSPTPEADKFPVLGVSSPIVLAPPKARQDLVRHPKLPRDSVVLAKKKVGVSGASSVVDEGVSDVHTRSERSFSLLSSTHSHHGSVTNLTSSAFPRKRHSLHTLQSSLSSSFAASQETIVDITPLAYPRSKLRRINPPRETVAGLPPSTNQPAYDVAAAPSVDSASLPRVAKASLFTTHDQMRMTSMDNRPATVKGPTSNPDDGAFDQTRVRTRSQRGWSASSATPTHTSDTSSNLFQRPPTSSTHTANTSVDFSNAAGSPISSSRDSSLDTGLSPKTPQSANFNIDDYLSSDDDSYATGHRPRGEGEEDLLFSDVGYGIHGAQLPGLFDSVPSPDLLPKKKMPLRTQSLTALSPVYYDSGTFGHSQGRRFILDTAADYSDDSEDDITEESTTTNRTAAAAAGMLDVGGESRGGSGRWMLSPVRVIRGARGTKRLSDLYPTLNHTTSSNKNKRVSGGGGPLLLPQRRTVVRGEVIEEERELGKIDVAAAVRLRKEVKALRRSSGFGGAAKPRRARSAAPVVMVTSATTEGGNHDEEDGNNADVE